MAGGVLGACITVETFNRSNSNWPEGKMVLILDPHQMYYNYILAI
jgi:hypothetical protein